MNGKSIYTDYLPMQKPGQSIGKGAFGYVTIMKNQEDHKFYAVKVIEKTHIEILGSIENLRDEVDIHRSLEHPNIIQLKEYFEDNEFIYIVTEYAKEGNLFNHIEIAGKLGEKDAFKMFHQIV